MLGPLKDGQICGLRCIGMYGSKRAEIDVVTPYQISSLIERAAGYTPNNIKIITTLFTSALDISTNSVTMS